MDDYEVGSAGSASNAASSANNYQPWVGQGFGFRVPHPDIANIPGLLDVPKPLGRDQACADCGPGMPCADCDEGLSQVGQVIKTQMPMPFPGWVPPPPITTFPQTPNGPPVYGNPNAWWNWGDSDLQDWIDGVFHSRPSSAVEQLCEKQRDDDYAKCEEISAKAPTPQLRARELEACQKQSMVRYGECRKNNGKSTSPKYPDWYGTD